MADPLTDYLSSLKGVETAQVKSKPDPLSDFLGTLPKGSAIQAPISTPTQPSYPDSGLKSLQEEQAARDAEEQRRLASASLPTFTQRTLSSIGGSENLDMYEAIQKKYAEDAQRFLAENQTDVPLDINDSADAGTRFAFSHKSPQEQFDALAAEGLKPRVSADGKRVIIRTPDGKKDVLYSPQGLDVAGNIAPVAEQAGKIAAATLVGQPGLGMAGNSMGVVRGLGALSEAGSLGLRTSAAASIPATTLAGGGTLRDAAIDTALNVGPTVGLAALGKAGGAALNYLRSAATPEEQAALDASRAASARLGISAPVPPRLFTAQNAPLAGDLGKRTIASQGADIERALSERGLGAGASVPLESDISRRAAGPLADVGANAQRVADTINADTRAANAVRQAEADAINATRVAKDKASRDAAQEAIRKGVADTLGPRAVTADTEMGVGSRMVGAVRGIDQAAGDALQTAKNEIFSSAPDATVSLDNLNALRAGLRDKVSSLGVDVEPLLAQIDSKIKTLVQGGKSTMAKAGAEGEAGLMGLGADESAAPLATPATKGMVEVPPADPVRLSPAQADELRQYIDSGISFKDAGTKGDALKVQFRNALRDDTAASLEAHTPGLGEKYTNALDSYSDTATKLGDARIKPALLGDETGRSLVPENIVDNLLSNRGSPSGLDAFERALGKESPEFQAALRQGLARTVAKAEGDPVKLVADLVNMHPEFRARLLGPDEAAIMEKLNAQSVLSKALKGTDVPTSELAAAMKAAPPDVAASAQKSIDASMLAKQKFEAVLEKEVAEPEISPHLADLVANQPEHLVSALDSSGSAEKTRRVLGVLDAQTKDDFHRRALQNILDKSSETTPKTMLPTGRLDPNKLRAALDSGDKLANVQEMVGGDEAVQFLRDLADVLTQQNANIATSDAAKLTGGSVYHGIKEGGVTGLGGGLLAGNATKGSGIGAGIGLLAKTVPRMGQALLGNEMRREAVKNFLINGELPDFVAKAAGALGGTARVAPAAINTLSSLAQRDAADASTIQSGSPTVRRTIANAGQ